MSQLPRLMSILTMLKSKRLITGNEIANKFDVSLRTIYRDIRKLEKAGVPIITVEGKGYSIMDGYTVAPVKFQQEEVNALVTAEKIIAKTKNEKLIANFGNALVKIKSTFQSNIQTKSELLDAKMLVFSTSKTTLQSNSLTTIQLAITNFYIIKIKYQKVNSEEVSEREVEPTAMYSYDEKWIVIAWCHLRDDYRTFRLDRILEYKLLNKKFEDRNFEFSTYFKEFPDGKMNP
jgi:predicted DNA-binding transcriptional regulator YafY